MLENALAQFWEHTDRWVDGSGPSKADGAWWAPAAAAAPLPLERLLSNLLPRRLEKCASLLSRKDLAAVKRRYQQLEVRPAGCQVLLGGPGSAVSAGQR